MAAPDLPYDLIDAGYKVLVYPAGFLYASSEEKRLTVSPEETYVLLSARYGCTIRSPDMAAVVKMARYQVWMGDKQARQQTPQA